MLHKDELNQLFRYALSLTRQEDSAYDLVQSAVERYIKKSPASIEKPMAYLKTIIRNLFIDIERHNKVVPMVSIENEEVSYIEPVDDNLMEDLLINQQEIKQLIALLSPEENELLYLWAVEEHTVEEISIIYNKPKGTILSKLHRLKIRIRKQFKTTNELPHEINKDQHQ